MVQGRRHPRRRKRAKTRDATTPVTEMERGERGREEGGREGGWVGGRDRRHGKCENDTFFEHDSANWPTLSAIHIHLRMNSPKNPQQSPAADDENHLERAQRAVGGIHRCNCREVDESWEPFDQVLPDQKRVQLLGHDAHCAPQVLWVPAS